MADSPDGQATLDEIYSRLDDLEELCESLTTRVESLEEHAETVEQRVDVVTSQASHLADGLDETEAQIADVEQAVEELKGMVVADVDADLDLTLTPIERVAVQGEEALGRELTKTERRAVTIVEHFDQWSRSVRGGTIIDKETNIKELLSTACGTDLHWTAVHRAMKKASEMGEDKLEYRQEGDRNMLLRKERLYLTSEALLEEQDTSLKTK